MKLVFTFQYVRFIKKFKFLLMPTKSKTSNSWELKRIRLWIITIKYNITTNNLSLAKNLVAKLQLKENLIIAVYKNLIKELQYCKTWSGDRSSYGLLKLVSMCLININSQKFQGLSICTKMIWILKIVWWKLRIPKEQVLS